MTQTISIKLNIQSGQEPYVFEEGTKSYPYLALRHFFVDIGYDVEKINSQISEGA